MQHHNRVNAQWTILIDNIVTLEDLNKSLLSVDRLYHHSVPHRRPDLFNRLYSPRIGNVLILLILDLGKDVEISPC